VTLLIGLFAGGASAAVLWIGMRSTFAEPLFARTNHRGITVPVGAGIILSLAVLAAAALEWALVGLGVDQEHLHISSTVLVAALGFGLLGFLDDLVGTDDHKGFAGHLKALRSGRLTTGGLKVLGGGALAAVVTGGIDASRPGRFVVDTLLVALSANLGNLFDRAPGRAIKLATVFGGLLVLTHVDAVKSTGLLVVLGAALGLAWFDLGEQLMLGDAGANVLGAVLGISVVLCCDLPVRIGVLVVVAALNLLSEWVSFSTVIDRWAPLRAIDRLGRRRG
jgi:UDP-GlcNAc:undecaprenyl-phosphate GlcNAc-1-phosphate transferase